MGGEPGQPPGDVLGHEGPEAEDAENAKATLLDNVQHGLEEILSKRNLAEDAFIQQHMNAQLYIPACVLAGHRRIEELGSGVDVATLLEAARRSEKLGVDEDSLLIRPLLKPKRNTLILHDLPQGISEEELRELFNESPDPPSSVKPDVNRTAFVSFQTDDAAQRAALWLRSQTLRGASVRCAVKSEHFLRSFFPVPPASPAITHMSAGGGMPFAMSGQAMVWMPQQWAGSAAQHWHDAGGSGSFEGSLETWGNSSGSGWCPDGEAAPDIGFGGKDGGVRDKGSFKGKGHGRQRHEGPSQGFDEDPIPKAPSSNFPPAEQEPFAGGVDAGDLDYVELRYKHEFRRYTRDEIIQVCSCMEEVTKPESYERIEREGQDMATLFRQNPCKDWAPLPTPQLSFASNFIAGDSRRSSSMDDQRPEPEHSPEQVARKASSTSPWIKSSRPPTGSEHQEEPAPWDWGPQTGADGWSQEVAGRWRSKSWNQWHGQQWVEKGQVDQEAEKKEVWAPKPTSWVEKVRGYEKGGTPQKWQARKDAQKEDDDNRAGNCGETPDVAAPLKDQAATTSCAESPRPAAECTGSARVPAAAAVAAPVATQATDSPAKPIPLAERAAPTTPTAPAALSWADKVRRGSPASATVK